MARSGRARWIGFAVGVAALAGVAAAAWLASRPAGPERIVFIVVDTLRRDHVGAYGGAVPTPNMDALAARGQRFENAVGSFHQTSMSMGAMFTGRTPSIETGTPGETLPWNSATWCGMARFRSGDGEPCIPRSLPTLGERMRDAGYWTIGVASNQFLYEPSGFSRGFEDWTQIDARTATTGPASREGVRDPRTSRYWKSVNRTVDVAVARRRSDRFFLYVHYVDVHDWRFQSMSYAEAVAMMDHALGLLLQGLAAQGVLDGAVVVLTSDHGERLGEAHGIPGEWPNSLGHYGNPSWQEELRIPLIVAPPVFADTQRMVRTQDFYRLVQEIAGVAPTPSPDTTEAELFVGELRYRTYREGRFKTAVRRTDGRAFHYDLESDPHEQHDISKESALHVLAHRNRINELSRTLAAAPVKPRDLSPEEKERLRVLGYLEESP